MKKKKVFIYISIVSLVVIIFSFMCLLEKTNNINLEKSMVTIISGVDLQKEILVSDVIVGSGFCYKPNRIITNYHNIQDNDEFINVILYNDTIVKAKIIAKDKINDIALLAINADIPAVSFGDTKKIKIGQVVSSISTPISVSLRNTYSRGIITNLDIVGFGTQRLIQTDISLSPGCSGSPLISKKGKVIGMITFKSTEFGADGLGFAIPSERLEKMIYRLENGITTIDLKIDFFNDIYQKYGIPKASGLLIKEINDNSPAKDYLYSGDCLIAIDEKPVGNIIEYTEALENWERGSDLKLTVIRNSKEEFIILKGDTL